MKIIYLLMYLLFVSCNTHSNKEDEIKKPKRTLNYKHNQDTLSYNDLMFLTRLEAIKKYGNPKVQERYLLDNMVGEFWNGIYYGYPEKDRKSNSIYIQELTWEKSKNIWVTVWYQETKNGEMIPKDTLTWRKGTDF